MKMGTGNFSILVSEARNLKGYLQKYREDLEKLKPEAVVTKEDLVDLIESLLTEVPMLQADPDDILVLRANHPKKDDATA
jgi:hypothetical protein